MAEEFQGLSIEQFNNLGNETAVAEPPVVTDPPTGEPPASTEPPVTIPPVSTEPPVSTDPSAQIDLTPELRLKAFNELMGTSYATVDDINPLKADIAEIPSYKEIKTKYETAPPKPKFASPRLEELNTFIAATNIDDEGVFKSLKRYTNTTEKDSLEALILAKLIKNPNLIDDREMVRETIADGYNLTIDPDGDPIEEAKRVEKEKFKMKMAAQEANELIESTMGKVTAYVEAQPKDNTAENQQKVESNQLQWNTTTSDNSFKEQFKAIEVAVPLGKTASGVDLGTETIKYELTAEQQANQLNFIQYYIKENKLEHNDEAKRNLVELVHNMNILGNLPSILAKATQAAVAKADLEHIKAVHNPSALKTETPQTGKTDLTEQEKVKIYIETGKMPS